MIALSLPLSLSLSSRSDSSLGQSNLSYYCVANKQQKLPSDGAANAAYTQYVYAALNSSFNALNKAKVAAAAPAKNLIACYK